MRCPGVQSRPSQAHWWICAVLLSGCALIKPIPAACVSKCGLRLIDPVPVSWSCLAFQDLEDSALRAFEHVSSDARFKEACPRVQGWIVMIVPSKNFAHSQFGTLVGGETSCDLGWSRVGNSDPKIGRLAHELGHAVQRCTPTTSTIALGEDGFHAGWTEIFSALKNEGLPE